jgi:hypothetical protein
VVQFSGSTIGIDPQESLGEPATNVVVVFVLEDAEQDRDDRSRGRTDLLKHFQRSDTVEP